MNILFIGDIAGRCGRTAVAENVYQLREKYDIDFCIANCENAAGGFGITYDTASELVRSGCDAFTTGNHVFSKRDIIKLFDENEFDIIRPYNLPKNDPGHGYMICTLKNGEKVAVVNLLGRLYSELPVSSAFDVADDALSKLEGKVNHIVVDIHAEATSEKRALGYYLDGRVTAVLGTHTHVQTADEMILPNGTAYITDVGMCSAKHSVLGAEIKLAISRFRSAVPGKFQSAEGERQFNAVVIETGEGIKAKKIFRINL